MDKEIIAKILTEGILGRIEYLEECALQVDMAHKELDRWGVPRHNSDGQGQLFIYARIEKLAQIKLDSVKD